MLQSEGNCPRCANKGWQSSIKVIRVAKVGPFRFCSEPTCTYPLDLDDGQIFSNNSCNDEGVIVIDDKNEVDENYLVSDDPEPSTSTEKKIESEKENNALEQENPADLLVDLTAPDDEVEDESVEAGSYEEECELLRKVLNMYVSDDEEDVSPPSVCASSSTSENDSTASISESLPIFPQWRNKRNMCWLDSTLSLLLMSPLRSLALNTLKTSSESSSIANGKSMMLDNLLSDSFKDYHRVLRRVKHLQYRVSSPDLNEKTKLSYRRLKGRLERIRMKMLDYLQKHCNIGHDESGDSPVFALSALLNKVSCIRPLFDSVTNYDLGCSSCAFHSFLPRENPIVCLVKCPDLDFRFHSEGFTLKDELCEHCLGRSQTRHVRWSRLNRFLLVQFCNGLSRDRSVDEWLKRLTFEVKGINDQAVKYVPIGVIQYKTLPSKANHFVTWIHSPDHNYWLESDDMNGRFCFFDKKDLPFPASELHLVLFLSQPSNPDQTDISFPLSFASEPSVPIASSSLGAGSSCDLFSSDEDDVVKTESGISFASIASTHIMTGKKRKVRNSSSAPVVKKLRICLKRCDAS